MIQTHRQLPDIPTGYPLESGKSWFSVVVPVARTNEVTNPSAELATTTGYTAGSGALTTTTAQQYHGARSFQYTPAAALTDGFYATLTTTIALRAISCKFKGAAGVRYTLAVATTAPSDLVTYTFTATGRWQWIWLYFNENSATTRRLYFRKASSASVQPFYVDGVQSEIINAGETVSTYLDGEQQGFVPNQSPAPYYWTGTPHASTSVRSGLTRAGGMVIPFRKYGFLLTAIIGLGLAAPQNVTTDYARIDGGYPDFTRKPSRQFTLTGRFQAATAAQLDRYRAGLSQLLDRDLTGQDQELLLRYVRLGADDQAISEPALLRAKYESGLSGSADNLYAETAPLTFTQYLPGIFTEGEQGASLASQTSVTNANAILQRSPAGVWAAMGTGSAAAGTVEVIVVGRDGTVYAGGLFGSMGGVANTPRIAQWNPNTGLWAAMGTGGAGVGNRVYALAIAPNGDLIAMGDFTSMGGVANTASIAKWNGSAWSSITPGGAANGSVLSGAFDSLGTLYVTGGFTNINGVAATRIAKYDGTTWTALSTGLTAGAGNTIVTDAGNNVYVGGSFTDAGGITNTVGIAKWDGAAFTALGSGLSGGAIRAIAFDNAGNLYAGGQFTGSGLVVLTKLARWNGTAWFPLSTGTLGSTNSVTELVWRGDQNALYVGGTFTSAGGITLPDSFAIWTGGGFIFPDIDLPASSQVNSIAFGFDGALYLGFDQIGTATAGSVTTITNSGSARAYPQIRLTGPTSGAPARVWSIVDVTTNRALYFNLLLNVGEIATLSLQPDNLFFTSNVQGDIMGKIAPGSNTADFFLQPGANSIAMLSGSSTITTTIYWRPNYARLDDLTR